MYEGTLYTGMNWSRGPWGHKELKLHQGCKFELQRKIL